MRVLIADDQVHIRQALQALLTAWPEIEVVGLTANSEEIVQRVEECQPTGFLGESSAPASRRRAYGLNAGGQGKAQAGNGALVIAEGDLAFQVMLGQSFN